ncbi:MAG: hypothetical protein HC800_20545 [Phormidesmis sp. RL_2_1]|nr:hypothetical protein [Phormidesmis sp. RL_2_1]
MSTNITDFNNLLERIAVALESRDQPRVKQGFSDYDQKVYCNVTKGNGDGWYSLVDDVAMTQKPVFRGELVSIGFPTLARRGQDVRKFHLVMQTDDGTVTFESGHDCFFSKTILAAFALSSPEMLSRPIQLATYIKQLNTGDKTLAVSLRDHSGNRLQSDWTNDDDWKAIAMAAMCNVNDAVASR